MSSKAAILRLVPIVRPRLSAANALRLDQVLELISTDGKAVLADLLNTLYPRQNRHRALTSFRQFRREIVLATEKADVQFSLETDGQTRSSPNDRVVWFDVEDRIKQEVKRMVESEIGDVERTPQ